MELNELKPGDSKNGKGIGNMSLIKYLPKKVYYSGLIIATYVMFSLITDIIHIIKLIVLWTK